MPQSPIGLWRRTFVADAVCAEAEPSAFASAPSVARLTAADLFPSGRRALTAALTRAGLGRSDVVAVPEWSSACVIGAVGEVAAPVPMRAVLSGCVEPSALVVYEMWGWPVPTLGLARLQRRFPEAAIILDRVDTLMPGISLGSARPAYPECAPVCHVWSFGKTLGCIGGGALSDADGRWVECVGISPSGLESNPINQEDARAVNRFRTESAAPSEEIAEALRAGRLAGLIEAETRRRRENAAALRATNAALSWPPWMLEALEAGAAPGLAPVLISHSRESIEEERRRVLETAGLAGSVYRFNVSGDPGAPDYRLCLALPLHGEVPPETFRALFSAPPVERRRPVVVGAGVSGLFSARVLAGKGAPPLLIDTAERAGGLYCSRSDPAGRAFDLGVHIPMTAGAVDVDRMLFPDPEPAAWTVITRSLREGVYQGAQTGLDLTSGCPSIMHWPSETRRLALGEMTDAAADPERRHEASLYEQLLDEYGAQLTEKMFRPILKKLTGEPLERLARDTHRLFSLTRLRATDWAATLDLKRSPALDAKLAYVRSEDGGSDTVKLYPRRGGAEFWIRQLTNDLTARGVEQQMGARIEAIERRDRRIRALTLQGGTRIETDHLIWTPPPALLLRALGESVDSIPPTFRDMLFVDLVLDRPLPHDLEYMCCYAQEFLTFRVGFYPALTSPDRPAKEPWLTAEIIVNQATEDVDEAALPARVLEELIEMGAASAGSQPIASNVVRRRNALPILSPEAAESQAGLVERAAAQANNITLIGRNARGHFINAILMDAYEALAFSDPWRS